MKNVKPKKRSPSKSKIPKTEFARHPERTTSDWLEFMEQWGSLTPDKSIWTSFVDLWRSIWTKHHEREEVETFLKAFARPDAFDERCRAQRGVLFTEIRDAVYEPLCMALGSPNDIWAPAWPSLMPGDPAPTQLDFDRRLAEWLRAAVVEKNSKALRHLATALEMMPWLHPGITAGEVFNRLAENPPSIIKVDRSRQENVLKSFWKFVEENHQLPTKAKLRALSHPKGDDNINNFSAYLKKLGLAGLPKKERESPKFVSPRTKRLRTQGW